MTTIATMTGTVMVTAIAGSGNGGSVRLGSGERSGVSGRRGKGVNGSGERRNDSASGLVSAIVRVTTIRVPMAIRATTAGVVTG